MDCFRIASRTFGTALVLGAVHVGAPPSAAAAGADFVPGETQVSTRIDLFDNEFNQSRNKYTWVDALGNLWVSNVDPKTGDFKPASGKGVLVDPDAENSGDLKLIGNGPEWLPAAGPNRIVYTKFVAGKPHTLDNARLAMATQDSQTGKWSYGFLDNLPRYRVYASTDPGDPKPRISYLDPAGNAYWRYVDVPSSESIVPWMAGSRTLAMRFASGEYAAVFLSDISGVTQVVRLWLDTQRLEQLTFDDNHDKTTSPFIWKAPEFGNDDVMVTTAEQATEVRVYRQLDKSNPAWSVVFRAAGPVPGSKFSSVEPFVFNGKSYVFMSAVVPPNNFASTIYVMNIDAASPMIRQVSPDAPVRTRTDPEVYVTSTGPQIYYYRADRTTTPPCPCYDGMFRADTGLR